MRKYSQAGFAVVELAIVVVVVAALAGTGYFVWHQQKQKSQPTATATTPAAAATGQTSSSSVPAAPQVDNASDLNSAMQSLNQTDVAAGNSDSAQLSTQASSF